MLFSLKYLILIDDHKIYNSCIYQIWISLIFFYFLKLNLQFLALICLNFTTLLLT